MTAPVSRRDFLKRLAAAGGSISGPPPAFPGASRFDFATPQTLAALLSPPSKKRLLYAGSATSHFQAEPLLYDASGNALVCSDWEYEVIRRQRGERSDIPRADINNLPRFLLKKDDYLRRSSALCENAFRFSLDFARLCPRPGEFNDALMSEYIRVLALIKAHGQEPFLTLHHFTMPRYLITTDRHGEITAGGWEHPDVVRHFRFFISNVIAALTQERRVRPLLRGLQLTPEIQDRIVKDGLVRYMMTINEPAVILFNGYLSGTMPPYKTASVLAMRRVFSRLIEVHDLAFNEIKQACRRQSIEPQLCIGHNWQDFDGMIGELVHWFQSEWTARFERDGQHTDFLALHYYFRQTIPLSARERRGRDYSDQPRFGDVYPPGILRVLNLMHAAYPRKDIFVAEIGFDDKGDRRRPYWILETIRYIIEAIRVGIPITGVLLWSLVDNFEWEFGMSGKFGLFSESELATPLASAGTRIRSWEVWRAVASAIRTPSSECLREVQRTYESAYAQYKQSGGHY